MFKTEKGICWLCKDVAEVINEAETINYTKESNTAFLSILQDTLDYYIPVLNSELCLCEDCVILLNELDVANINCNKLKQRIASYYTGFEVLLKKVDTSCQTEPLSSTKETKHETDLNSFKQGTNEISDDIEFEYVNNETMNIKGAELKCYICCKRFNTEREMTIHLKNLHHITIRKARTKRTKSQQMDFKNKVTIKKVKSGGSAPNMPIVIGNYILNDHLDDLNIAKLQSKLRRKNPSTESNGKDDNFTEFIHGSNSAMGPIIINSNNINTSLLGVEQTTKKKKLKSKVVLFKCDVCSRKWRTEEAKNNHICGCSKDTSEGSNSFICEICGLTYKYRTNLEAHAITHTGIYPYVCSYCSKPFTKKASLQRHLPIHTGVKNYQCDSCGKSFIHNSSFRTHMEWHAGQKRFTCTECGVSLFSRQHLARHMRAAHTREKKHKCKVCNKHFAERYNLYTHLNTHLDKINAYGVVKK